MPSVSQDLYQTFSHFVAWLQVIEDAKDLVAQGKPSKTIENLDEYSLHAAEMVSACGLAVEHDGHSQQQSSDAGLLPL